MNQNDKEWITEMATMNALSFIQKTITTTPNAQLEASSIEQIMAILGGYIDLQIAHGEGAIK